MNFCSPKSFIFFISIAISLLNVFKNYNLQSLRTYSGIKFKMLAGFTHLVSSNKSYYYVSDFESKKIFILNDNWNLLDVRSFAQFPGYMITIDGCIYMTTPGNLYITNQDLMILVTYVDINSSGYSGIYYNSSNKLIFFAAYNLKEIHVFDIYLRFNHSISTSTFVPLSVVGNTNRLYVGTSIGKVIIIVNKKIIAKFDACNQIIENVNSILIDQYGYLATTCPARDNSFSYLYFVNGTFAKKRIPITGQYAQYIGFDSIERFIILTNNQILLYY